MRPLQSGLIRGNVPALIVALALLLSACGEQSPAVNSRFKAFGTSVDLTLLQVAPERAEQAVETIRQDFAALERDLQVWGDGQMARVNRLLPTGEAFEAPVTVLPLVHLSQRYAELTDDLFNPAIGKLIALWGFNVEVPEGMRPPPEPAIAQLLEADPRMSDIEIDILQVRGNNAALRLDFSPIIPAYAIDLAVARLRELDVRHAMIKIGADLRAIGDRSDQPWRIPVRRGGSGGVFATLNIEGDESVATRTAQDRDWIHDGVTYHPILDPRSGRPARGVQAVTVVHPEATVAAAAAVALFVAGPDGWHDIARSLGIRYALLVDDDGRVHLNPGFRDRLTILDREAPLVLSPPLASP
ncbi:FAD:protein FMN transferase [Thiohalocapsa marina]|uniref:FAD:protein FMN transferase n=1 Tax=Thiohalocapsa marina TaxID=424902 RepID=A0A5M8FJV2_9GAMM|nr:FAD:protein FMN transferase [Thiohalocapsa marina]KAA6185193.1 FAD:protein FMN transferase [Thiohalocapsa marina]